MKITIIQGAFLPVPPVAGGAVEKIWYKLGEEFAALGHQVTSVSRQYAAMPHHEIVNGVEYIRVKGYDTPPSGIKLKVYDLLYSLRAVKKVPVDTDVIVTNTFWSPVLMGRNKVKKVMVSVERMPKGQMKLYKKTAFLRANSTPVVDAIKSEITHELYHKVIMVPNPLPMSVFPDLLPTHREKTLLYVGRIHPEKGLDLLLKAFKKVSGNWKLKIVGPWENKAGGGGDEYINLLRQLAEGSDVIFTGPVYNMEELNKYYATASVFVYPSVAEKGETFGLAPLEAMAWGCVPVVSSLACFQDFIVDNENGLIFDHRSEDAVMNLYEQIQRVIEDVPLRERMADEALKVRASHSISSIAQQFISGFEKINLSGDIKP